MADAKRTRLVTFFTHPVVGIAGSVASLVGLALAVYFYIAAQAAPEVLAYVSPVRATVVKRGEASSLAILHNGRRIESDITAVQVALWNRGKQPVRQADILARVRIVTAAPVLEATVRKRSRPVVSISLDTSRAATGEVGVAWNILEHGDGAVIQIIYAGNPKVDFSVVGTIVGQGPVEQQRYGRESPTAAEQFASAQSKSRANGWIVIALGAFYYFVFYILPPRSRVFPLSWKSVLLPLVSVTVILVGVYLLLSLPAGPPFGF